MGGKAWLWQWVQIVIIAVTVLSELILAGLSLQDGRFRVGQVFRVLLTGWLLWQVWNGASWARWLMAGLFLITTLFAAVVGVGALIAEGRPEVVALGIGSSAVCVGFGLSMASPWVAAYQAARRGSLNDELAPTADQPRE